MVESIRTRYLSKLLGNVANAVLSFLLQVVITRTMGPAAYGVYTFLRSQISDFLVFSEMNASDWFFYRVARERSRYRLVGTVLGIAVLFSSLFAFVVTVASVSSQGLMSNLWPDITVGNLWAGLAFGWSFYLFARATMVADVAGISVAIESIRLARTLAYLLCAVCVASLGILTVNFLLVSGAIIFIIAAFVVFRRANSELVVPREPWRRLGRAELKVELRQLAPYCFPLALTSCISAATSSFDRWLLQMASGSVEQGFFSFGQQVGAACFLVTGAMTPVFFREVVYRIGNSDFSGARSLFLATSRRLFFIISIPCIFLAFFAQDVVLLLAGRSFEDAYWTTVLLVIYPIHQTYGQLSTMVLYAASQTRFYLICSGLVSISGIFVTYLLVAGVEWRVRGLGLGSLGLAAKLLGMQALCVTIINFRLARFLSFSFVRSFFADLVVVGALGAGSFMASRIALMLVEQPSQLSAVVRCTIGGSFYGFFVFLFVMAFPKQVGMARTDIVKFAGWLRKSIF